MWTNWNTINLAGFNIFSSKHSRLIAEAVIHLNYALIGKMAESIESWKIHPHHISTRKHVHCALRNEHGKIKLQPYAAILLSIIKIMTLVKLIVLWLFWKERVKLFCNLSFFILQLKYSKPNKQRRYVPIWRPIENANVRPADSDTPSVVYWQCRRCKPKMFHTALAFHLQLTTVNFTKNERFLPFSCIPKLLQWNGRRCRQAIFH